LAGFQYDNVEVAYFFIGSPCMPTACDCTQTI